MSETDLQIENSLSIRSPSLWTVTILNDDFTPIDFVIDILVSIFRKSVEEATEMTIRVHEQGKAVVGVYTKDVATTRVTRAIRLAEEEQHPLQLKAQAAE